MLELIVQLAIFAIILVFAWWVLTKIAFPPPVRTAVEIAFAAVAVVIVIYFLLALLGMGSVPRFR